MLTREQRVYLLGILATVSITSVGFAIGGTIGASVMAGIGINLSSNIIQSGFVRLKERWLSSNNGILNYDIQQALVRAFVKALTHLEREYFRLGQAISLPEGEKESIRQLFRELKKQAQEIFPASLERAVRDEEVKGSLYGKPETTIDKLWERIEKAKLLRTYNEHFRDFLCCNLPREMQFWFGEELKIDSRECNKAWRAFQRLLLEGIQADVIAVQASQEEIQQDLQKLDELKSQLDELRDTIDYRLPNEPFQHELEKAIGAMRVVLQDMARTAQRVERRIETLEVGIKGVAETTRLVGEEVRTIAVDVRDVKELVLVRAILPRPELLENLPSRRASHFIGRENEKRRVLDGLESGVPRTLISGSGGMGKTTLALEIAHHCMEKRIFEAIIWDTTESGRELRLDSLLNAIAETLYLEGYKKLPEEDKELSILRAVRVFRTLIIVDGFETVHDSEIETFLRKLPSSAQLLTTSRYLYAVPEEEVVFLREMDEIEALELIRIKSKMKKLARASGEILKKLCRATGGMPLALEWATGQINTGRQALESVVHHLEIAKAEAVYDRLFNTSYEALTDTEKRILWSLSIFVGSATKSALQFVTNLPHDDLDAGLEQLVEMSLVYTNEEFEETNIRYSVHSLLRNFAQRMLGQQHASAADGLVERFVSFFSNYAEREIPSLVERKRIHGCQLEVGVEDISATMRWVEVELDNTRAAMNLCHERNYWNALTRLVRAMSYFYATRGYWSERIRHSYRVAEAAAKSGNKKEEAWMYVNEVGYLLIQQGRWDEAEKVILRGQEILEREMKALEDRGEIEEDAQDQQGIQFMTGLVKRYLGILFTKQSNYEAAEQAFEQAMEVFKRLDRESILANQKTEMGELALRQGDYQLAKRYYQESLNYHDNQKDKKLWVYSWMARANNGLGDIAYQQGNYSEAREFYEEGLECALRTNSQDGIAYSKYRLALISEYEHQFDLALQLAEESWGIQLQVGRSEYIEDVEEMIERLGQLVAQS